MKSGIIIAILLAVGSISIGIAFAVPLVQSGGSAQDIAIGNGNKLYLDGGTNSYLTSPGSNEVSIYSGGTQTLTANNGNVGIGTSSPQALLDVNGGVITRSQVPAISFLGDISGARWMQGLGNYKLSFYSDNSNQNGLGGNQSFNGETWIPKVKFDTNGDVYTAGSVYAAENIGISTTNPLARLDLGANPSIFLEGNSNQWGFDMNVTDYGSGNVPLMFISRGGGTNNEVMRITHGGNVGIGTTGPLSKLDINGGLAVGSYAGSNAAPSNGAIISGNVGIGTSSPTAPLQVSATGGNTVLLSTTNTIGPALGLGGGTTFNLRSTSSGDSEGANKFFITNTGNSTDMLTITANDKVGIGTKGPLSKFDVNGSLAVGSYAGSSAAPSNGAIISGKVGIGTSSPQQALDVSGNMRLTGNLYDANTTSGGEFKITAPSGVPICIGTGC